MTCASIPRAMSQRASQKPSRPANRCRFCRAVFPDLSSWRAVRQADGSPKQASRQGQLAIQNRRRPPQAEETVPSVPMTRATSTLLEIARGRCKGNRAFARSNQKRAMRLGISFKPRPRRGSWRGKGSQLAARIAYDEQHRTLQLSSNAKAGTLHSANKVQHRGDAGLCCVRKPGGRA